MSNAYESDLSPSAGTISRKRSVTQVSHAFKTQARPAPRAEEVSAKSRLEMIGTLTDGWDGYGGMAPSMMTRICAWHALDVFFKEGLVPDITPTSNGTISFEWEGGGASAHLSIGRTRLSMYVTSEDDSTLYFDGPAKELPSAAVDALRAAFKDTRRRQERRLIPFG